MRRDKQKNMNKYKVVDAQYVGDYKIRIVFEDSHCVLVDFEPYFIKKPNPVYDEYHDVTRFKEFKIQNGNVVWGESWDLVFNPQNLYYNDLFADFEQL